MPRPARRLPSPRSTASSAVATILVVEDEESLAVTLGGILELEGYRLVLTDSVGGALRQIKRKRFDAALVDLRVGDDDGLMVLQSLKEQRPGTVGIVLTGYGSLEAAVEAMRAGADDFLLKPTDVNEL